MFKRIAALTVLTLVVAGVSSAALLTIDHFNTAQFMGVGPGGGNPLTGNQGAADAGAVGGGRNVAFTRTAGTGFEFINVTSSILEFNLGSGDNGYGRVLWDGDTNNALNPTGLNVNVSAPNAMFRFDARSDIGGTGYLVVFSSATSYSYVSFNLPAQGFAVPFTTYTIPLASLLQGAPALVQTDLGLAAASSMANLSQVGAFALYFNGTAPQSAGLDAQFEFLEITDVPEPATFGLVGSVLLAAGLLRRVRR